MATAARRLALALLGEVARGGPRLAERLAAPEIEALPPRDRPFLHELVLGTLRRRGSLDRALSRLLDQPFSRLAPATRDVLRLGAYQLLFLRVPDRAAVAESVDLAREVAPRQAGLVNAVLRRLSREGAPTAPDPEREPLAWLTNEGSLPSWLAARWLRDLGGRRAVARAQALVGDQPTVFRFNPRVADAERQALAAGWELRRLPVPGAWDASGAGAVPLAAAGVLYIQDQGSQLVAHLAAGGGLRLDACAAPGSKTTLMADLAGTDGCVVAAELSTRRLETLALTLSRWGCDNVSLLRADALRPPLRPGFHAVLLDAPCSGLGTLGRHPDIRWRVRPEDIPRQAARQRRLLDALAPLVRREGLLVYAVCSAEPEEGKAVVEEFLARRADFAHADLPAWAAPFGAGQGTCATRPEDHGGDAFFAAVLQRT